MASEIKVVTDNRKARHDYFIEETYEAGIELKGTEVKSLRTGKANLKDAYAFIRDGELFVANMHISPYEKGNRFNPDPKRDRKLLMHKKEIMRLWGKTREKGYTLVPLRIYFNEQGLAKLELALAKGKKLYDKRHDIAERDAKREIERAFKERW
ncbi:MAG: SsrA-binding protein [Clostridia bacterium]|nr:smpB [Clostridiales bacterium]MDK2985880.1 SsrA-binding protein [Clostridia bacterium]